MVFTTSASRYATQPAATNTQRLKTVELIVRNQTMRYPAASTTHKGITASQISGSLESG